MKRSHVISKWKDNYGNEATIEEVLHIPYRGAKRQKGYKLSLYAGYDDDFCFWVSMHESPEKAKEKLLEIDESYRNMVEIKGELIIETLDLADYRFIKAKRRKIKEDIIPQNKLSIKRMESIEKEWKEVTAYMANLVNDYMIDYDEYKIIIEYIFMDCDYK